MTNLPGDRSNNFHDKDGRHHYPHPSSYEPRRSLWSTSERRYAAHLDRHDEPAANPEPMDDDPEAVVTLFRHIELLKSIIAKEKLLIIAVRQKCAADGIVDDKAVTRMINEATMDEREL